MARPGCVCGLLLLYLSCLSEAADDAAVVDSSSLVPAPVTIVSPPHGPSPYSYTARWLVPRSAYPVTEYELECVEYDEYNKRWPDYDERYARIVYYTPPAADPLADFAASESGNSTVEVEYTLEGLQPASQYRLEILARSEMGWSDSSDDVFVFRTHSSDDPGVAVGSAHATTAGVASLIVLVANVWWFW